MARFKKDFCQVSPELMEEIQREANHARNIEKAVQLFDNVDFRVNQVGNLIDKLPSGDVVRPKKWWLNMFGIE